MGPLRCRQGKYWPKKAPSFGTVRIWVLYSKQSVYRNDSPLWAGEYTMTATNNKHSLSPVSLLTIILMFSLAGLLQAAWAAQFTPPTLEGFNLHDEREADGDDDGKNETTIKQYLNANGDSLVSFTSNGRIWAWSLDTRNDESGTKNYVIRDSVCDGVFDEVYGLDDEFHVPDCVK
jgi:hypothetical protein